MDIVRGSYCLRKKKPAKTIPRITDSKIYFPPSTDFFSSICARPKPLVRSSTHPLPGSPAPRHREKWDIFILRRIRPRLTAASPQEDSNQKPMSRVKNKSVTFSRRLKSPRTRMRQGSVNSRIWSPTQQSRRRPLDAISRSTFMTTTIEPQTRRFHFRDVSLIRPICWQAFPALHRPNEPRQHVQVTG